MKIAQLHRDLSDPRGSQSSAIPAKAAMNKCRRQLEARLEVSAVLEAAPSEIVKYASQHGFSDPMKASSRAVITDTVMHFNLF